jgi:glutamate synthase (NADPH) small chain
MADPKGFLTTPRVTPARRPVDVRIGDWREVYTEFGAGRSERQAGRCMDCGIPFCHSGCPLGNLIPEWNDLVWRQDWAEASRRLHATNNFPEFTGRLCPAPCESACVLGINSDPVTIKQVEVEIADRAWSAGWTRPEPPAVLTGRRVAVVGSGPAGLAAAQQLTRAGHAVTVFERADRIGGLLRYGIPEFKMEKRVLDRRLAQMAAEGVRFVVNAHVGVDRPAEALRREFDALVLCGGACAPRDLPIPGRDLDGVHFAMDYLTQQNRRCEGDAVPDETFVTAAGKRVVIIGGGDTGADCLGTAHRQGAREVHQLEILPRPPDQRADDNPWPQWPNIYRVSSAHAEGGERVYSVSTLRFVGDARGRLSALELAQVEPVREGGRLIFREIAGSTSTLPCELALLAMGFVGPERPGLLEQLGVALTERGNVKRDDNWMTSVPGVFTAGDMQRGQSLIVWAMAEGRSAARGVDRYLMGRSDLPAPLA